MSASIQELIRKANEIRLTVVKMVGPGKPGHFGGSCSSADIVAALYFHKMKHDPKRPKWPETLTEREKEVAGFLVEGKSRKQIAEMMYVAIPTVKRHTESIFSKLGIHSRYELIAKYGNHS